MLACGASHACRKLRAVNFPVLAMESRRKTALARLLSETKKAIAEDAAEAILLGCAGKTGICAELSQATRLPAIDGVVAAVKLAEALAGGGFATSTAGVLAFARDKSADLRA